ncbi:MAG: CHAT domain-containing protein [Richelia sp.]|nr:CHAT domain-containing protein [Richelia sp.]
MTQEFHISVTPVGQNDYLVRTEQVAPGVPLAEELVTWSVSDWLANAGQLMNDPLKSLFQESTTVQRDNLEETSARNSVNLVALGQKLYNALFQGTLRDSLITAQGIAQNQQQVLRLRLGLKDTQLARLPWEVMHQERSPIATGPYIAFSRYQSGIKSASPFLASSMLNTAETEGIHVLMVIASPNDQVRLDLLKQEASQLKQELEGQSNGGAEPSIHGKIQVTVLEQPGREELTQALEQRNFQVLHYSGHSNLGLNGGEIYLVNRDGLTETLSGDDLAGLLVNNNIQVAVFNSCLGTYVATQNRDNAEAGEQNLTETLVKRGIRGVLAMSERIPDQVALTLTQLFYRNLSQGYPVDLCVSRMRQGLISAYGSHQMYWALPTLYLQPEFDGYLCPGVNLPQSEELFDEYDPQLINSIIYSQTTGAGELALDGAETANFPPNSWELDWLREESWSNLDLADDEDATYAEDSAMISDLFRQLDEQKAAGEESAFAEELQQLSEDETIQDKHISESLTYGNEKDSLWGVQQNYQQQSPQTELQETVNVSNTVIQAENNNPSHTHSVSVAQITTTTQSNHETSQKKLPRVNFYLRGRQKNIIGVVGAGAIATVLGLGWWWQNRQPTLPDIPPIPSSVSSTVNQHNIDLNTSATGIVTAYATEKFTQGDLVSGLEAVEELLNRNALRNAHTALKFVDSEAADNPSFHFLSGRLIWQLLQNKDRFQTQTKIPKYSADDARRHWEKAVKLEPNSVTYTTALGFAYYEEGDVNGANNAWFKALNAASKVSTNKTPKTVVTKDEMSANHLTAYAGLALGLYKDSHQQSADKQEVYLNEAVKFQQMVLKEDSINFQLNKLAQNWLWSEDAIKDWKSLLQRKGRES